MSRKQCTSRRGSVTLLAVIVALGCLTRSAAVPLAVAGAVHFAWSKRYRDLTHYVCLVVLFITPWWLWVRTHSNQTASSLLHYYVSYSSEPPAFVIMWFDPFGAVEIVWGNLRYIVEALDLIFQSKIIPGLMLPCCYSWEYGGHLTTSRFFFAPMSFYIWFQYYGSYSSEPPAFVTIWFDPFGALEIIWGNMLYIVEALDLILQSRDNPRSIVTCRLSVAIGSMAVI